MKRLLLLFLCLFTLGCARVRASDDIDVDNPPPGATPHEIAEGDKAAKQLEADKTIKLLDPNASPDNKALLDKLNGMAKRLGAVSKRPLINYTVKVIVSKDVNAFTLPNGHIYVYQGLIDYAASDDELAGVLAHEIGHNVRMHALRGERTAKKMNWVGLAAMAAMLAGGYNGANIGAFSQYLLVGVMNGYGEGYEEEADAAGVREMIAAGYNPSAMVTFMQRLQLLEDRSPEVQLGIFATHPPSDQRAAAMLAQIEAAGLTFDPRDVTGAKQAIVTEKPDRFVVSLAGITLIEIAKDPADIKATPLANAGTAPKGAVPAKTNPDPYGSPEDDDPGVSTGFESVPTVSGNDSPAGKSPATTKAAPAAPAGTGATATGTVASATAPGAKTAGVSAASAVPAPPAAPVVKSEAEKRADLAARRINFLMHDNLQMYEVSATPDGQLLGRGVIIVAATAADAALYKSTPGDIAQIWLSHLRDIFWRESINGKI